MLCTSTRGKNNVGSVCLFYACSFSVCDCLSLLFDSILKRIKVFDYVAYFIICLIAYFAIVLIDLALSASHFLDHSDNNWRAAIGTSNGAAVLYSSSDTDNQHYICQYSCE